MGEEASAEKSPEMSPQDDCSKVPLTNDGVTVAVEEAKFVSNPNGDAKIDVEIPPTFSGLTKDELMKYSNDPFWVRLRWFLFVLFWLGWLAMLVVAIVIIIQAPGCTPPPELLWVQENPMLEVDAPNNLPTEKALLSKCDMMGISSVYFPNLMKDTNFQEMNYEAETLIKSLMNGEKQVVTDFPLSVKLNNGFYANATSEHLINADGTWNYTNDALPSALYHQITEWWIGEGVTGFLMQEGDAPEQRKFKMDLNELMKEGNGAIASNIVETKGNIETPSLFESFLEENTLDWNFFRFNPSHVAESTSVVTAASNHVRLVTIGLFLVPGTPSLNHFLEVDNSTLDLVQYLTAMKTLKGVQFGDTHFVNSTAEDVVAYTRVNKGSPAYAVALNFASNHENVTFEGTANVGSAGKTKLLSRGEGEGNLYDSKEKYDLNFVALGPYEGIVLEFVANF